MADLVRANVECWVLHRPLRIATRLNHSEPAPKIERREYRNGG